MLLSNRACLLWRARGSPWEIVTTSSLGWTSCRMMMTLRSATTAAQDTAGKPLQSCAIFLNTSICQETLG